jgi:hypothetical protein
MIDPKDLNAVLAKIRRVQELSKTLVANPHADAERIALDGEVQTWFAHNRGALLHAAQTEIRLLNLLGPIVAAAMNSIAATAGAPSLFAQGPQAQSEGDPKVESRLVSSRSGASLAKEQAKAELIRAAREQQEAKKASPEQQAMIDKVVAASDKASAKADRLCNLGCTPIVRSGDLKDTVAGEPDSKVTL